MFSDCLSQRSNRTDSNELHFLVLCGFSTPYWGLLRSLAPKDYKSCYISCNVAGCGMVQICLISSESKLEQKR